VKIDAEIDVLAHEERNVQ